MIEATRLLDPDNGLERIVTIVLGGGRVTWIGEPDEAPDLPDAAHIDGRKTWAIPGLIELHSHYTDESSLRRALALGVTTAHTIADPGVSLELQQRSNAPEARMPRLQLTTALFGEFPEYISPGTYEVKSPRTPAEARLDVQRSKLRGASAVKIWQDDGSLWFGKQRTFPPIPEAVFRAIVMAGQDARLRVYAHSWAKEFAEVAIASGVDSLIHPVIDGLLEDRHFEEMRRRGIGWATTMAVVLVYGDPQQYARRILSDPTLRESLTEEELARFEADVRSPDHQFHEIMPKLASTRIEYLDFIKKNTLRAHKLGVTIALGSDEIVGIGTHIEMELLEQLGLSPAEVLAATTQGSARALGLEDILGTVEVGKVADLLLLRSNPLTDIRNVRDIEWVIKGGHAARPAALWGSAESSARGADDPNSAIATRTPAAATSDSPGMLEPYPGAEQFCHGRVYPDDHDGHISWVSYATSESRSVVVDHYKKLLGAANLEEQPENATWRFSKDPTTRVLSVETTNVEAPWKYDCGVPDSAQTIVTISRFQRRRN